MIKLISIILTLVAILIISKQINKYKDPEGKKTEWEDYSKSLSESEIKPMFKKWMNMNSSEPEDKG